MIQQRGLSFPVSEVGSGEYLGQAVIPAEDSHIGASGTQLGRQVWQPPPCRCCAGSLADSCVFSAQQRS